MYNFVRESEKIGIEATVYILDCGIARNIPKTKSIWHNVMYFDKESIDCANHLCRVARLPRGFLGVNMQESDYEQLKAWVEEQKAQKKERKTLPITLSKIVDSYNRAPPEDGY
jgi:hypothetical protein